jgi:hypothetical protein
VCERHYTLDPEIRKMFSACVGLDVSVHGYNVVLFCRTLVCNGMSVFLHGCDLPNFVSLISAQTRGPAEFKHINKRRKRN